MPVWITLMFSSVTLWVPDLCSQRCCNMSYLCFWFKLALMHCKIHKVPCILVYLSSSVVQTYMCCSEVTMVLRIGILLKVYKPLLFFMLDLLLEWTHLRRKHLIVFKKLFRFYVPVWWCMVLVNRRYLFWGSGLAYQLFLQQYVERTNCRKQAVRSSGKKSTNANLWEFYNKFIFLSN